MWPNWASKCESGQYWPHSTLHSSRVFPVGTLACRISSIWHLWTSTSWIISFHSAKLLSRPRLIDRSGNGIEENNKEKNKNWTRNQELELPRDSEYKNAEDWRWTGMVQQWPGLDLYRFRGLMHDRHLAFMHECHLEVMRESYELQ